MDEAQLSVVLIFFLSELKLKLQLKLSANKKLSKTEGKNDIFSQKKSAEINVIQRPLPPVILSDKPASIWPSWPRITSK